VTAVPKPGLDDATMRCERADEQLATARKAYWDAHNSLCRRSWPRLTTASGLEDEADTLTRDANAQLT
jgi:hypothetical protein